MLRLPDFNELSAEQDDILDLPLDSSVIVTGPPGTGKTIIAIWRAYMLHKTGRSTLLLMFGKLLSGYTRAAVNQSGIDGIVSTYHSWFPAFFREAYGQAPPKIDQWRYDWQKCKEILISNPPPPKMKRHIIVDEGQDMPPDFYLVLRLISDSMTILADENQRITTDQSTIRDIKVATGIREVRNLTVNFRNTRQIAEVSAHFFTGLPTGRPALPPLERAGERPALSAFKNLNDSINRIVTYERNFRDRTIGVLVPYAAQVKSFHNRLSGKTANPVQVYLSGYGAKKLPAVDFADPGVKVVSWASAKGLEFDSVILPELQAYRGDAGLDQFKMQMYVLTSRARQDLFLHYSGEGEPAMLSSMPMNLLEDRR